MILQYPFIIGFIFPGDSGVTRWSSKGIPENTAEAVAACVAGFYSGSRNAPKLALVMHRSPDGGGSSRGDILTATLYNVNEVPSPTFVAERVKA